MDRVLLLPPSETKRQGGEGAFDPRSGRFTVLGPARRRVAAALATAMADPEARTALIGLRSERAALAAAANQSVVGAPVLPAGERYTGVVWSHLDVADLSGPARRRAEGVVVVSALGGLFGFDDPVPDYKLKMAARLPGLGPLAAFWREHAAPVLAELAAGRVVWDLLPEEHRKALPREHHAGPAIRVEFRTASGSGAAGHRAKAAKGRLARHLLEAPDPGPAAVEAFAWEGWRAKVEGPGLVVVRAPD